MRIYERVSIIMYLCIATDRIWGWAETRASKRMKNAFLIDWQIGLSFLFAERRRWITLISGLWSKWSQTLTVPHLSHIVIYSINNEIWAIYQHMGQICDFHQQKTPFPYLLHIINSPHKIHLDYYFHPAKTISNESFNFPPLLNHVFLSLFR